MKQSLSSITLKVRSIYPGTKYSDTCISDLAFRVSTSANFNQALALRNKKVNERFITQRLIKAKNMANLTDKGLVRKSYVRLAQSVIEKLPETQLPEIVSRKFIAQKPENPVLVANVKAYGQSEQRSIAPGNIQESLYQSSGSI